MPQGEEMTMADSKKRGGFTTLRVGEEEDPPVTTLAVGEEDPEVTTFAEGEEDPPITTLALGEEDDKTSQEASGGSLGRY